MEEKKQQQHIHTRGCNFWQNSGKCVSVYNFVVVEIKQNEWIDKMQLILNQMMLNRFEFIEFIFLNENESKVST